MLALPMTWFIVGLVLGVALGAALSVLIMLKVKNGTNGVG